MTDSAGNWPDWGKLFNGASLLAVGLVACAAAATVVSGGACAPLLVAACATFVAGGMTVLNGAAEMIESATDYNYMRDTVYGGNEAYYETQKNVFSTAAEVGTIALGAVSGSPNLCFVAGTMVLISEGAKAIEDIEAGDHVWAWAETTGEVALKEVVETYINEADELVHVFVNGEEIITTPAHPFYSPVKGWTEAIHLRAGDILVLVNGEYVVVEKVQHEILEAPVTVYNFQVEDYHTYYVANTGVLVHNSCRNPYGKKGGPAHQSTIKRIGDSLQDQGYTVNYEYRVDIPGGTKGTRYLDIYATNGIDTIAIQVGRMTTGGYPVSRERSALIDLFLAGIDAFFIAYN